MWIRSKDKKMLMNANILFITPQDGCFKLKGGIGNSEDEEWVTLGTYQTEAEALHELDIVCGNQNFYWVGVTTEFTR
jgi:hypothetical protein